MTETITACWTKADQSEMCAVIGGVEWHAVREGAAQWKTVVDSGITVGPYDPDKDASLPASSGRARGR